MYSLLLSLKQTIDQQETVFFLERSNSMHCQRILFPIFFIVYILTGVILAIVALFLYTTKDDHHQYGVHMSRPAKYYINAVSVYILVTCIIMLIALFFRKKTILFFRIAIGLLISAIILQITTVALIVFMRGSTDVDSRRMALIVISSLTCYLVILQIYGVIASLSYLSELRHKYAVVSTK